MSAFYNSITRHAWVKFIAGYVRNYWQTHQQVLIAGIVVVAGHAFLFLIMCICYSYADPSGAMLTTSKSWQAQSRDHSARDHNTLVRAHNGRSQKVYYQLSPSLIKMLARLGVVKQAEQLKKIESNKNKKTKPEKNQKISKPSKLNGPVKVTIISEKTLAETPEAPKAVPKIKEPSKKLDAQKAGKTVPEKPVKTDDSVTTGAIAEPALIKESKPDAINTRDVPDTHKTCTGVGAAADSSKGVTQAGAGLDTCLDSGLNAGNESGVNTTSVNVGGYSQWGYVNPQFVRARMLLADFLSEEWQPVVGWDEGGPVEITLQILADATSSIMVDKQSTISVKNYRVRSCLMRIPADILKESIGFTFKLIFK